MTKPVPQDMQDVIEEVSTTTSGRGDLANQYKVLDTIIEDAIKDTLPKDDCGAVHTIDHSHHEIHEGDYFFADDISTSIAQNGVYEWLLVTPNEDNYLHSLPQVIATGEFELQSFEGVTVTTNGTEIPLLNRSRPSTKTTNFKFYKNPTGANITGSTTVRSIRSGAGKSVGESRSESELILKKNTKYLIRVTARVAGVFASIHINGYTCGIGST